MSKEIQKIIERSIYEKNKDSFVYKKLQGLTTCKFCGGSGVVILNVSTGETKDCPKCHGSGIQDKVK